MGGGGERQGWSGKEGPDDVRSLYSCDELELCLGGTGEPWNNFEQGSDVVRCVLGRVYSGCRVEGGLGLSWWLREQMTPPSLVQAEPRTPPS